MRKTMLLLSCLALATMAATFVPSAIGQAEDAPRDRGVREEAAFAEELTGSVTVWVENRNDPVVGAGKFVKRLRLSDKEFLVFSDASGKVIVRTQTIVAMRVAAAK